MIALEAVEGGAMDQYDCHNIRINNFHADQPSNDQPLLRIIEAPRSKQRGMRSRGFNQWILSFPDIRQLHQFQSF